jgi:hypothetical protein
MIGDEIVVLAFSLVISILDVVTYDVRHNSGNEAAEMELDDPLVNMATDESSASSIVMMVRV